MADLITIDKLQAAKSGDELLDLMLKAGIDLSDANDRRLLAALKDDFTSKRRTIVRTMRAEKFFKTTDGSIDDAVVSQPAKVNQWFAKAMAELAPPTATDDSTSAAEPEPAPDSMRGRSRSARSAISGFFGHEIPLTVASTMLLDAIFDRFDDEDGGGGRGRGPSRRATEGAVEGVAHEIERVVPQVGRRAGRGIRTFLKWGLIVLGVYLLLLWLIGPIMLVPLILIVGLGWGIYLLIGHKVEDRRYDRRLDWLRLVGQELPVVLRGTGISLVDLADKTNTTAWSKVLTGLRKNLDSRMPWHNDREAQYDNLLVELIGRLTVRYGTIAAAQAAFENPAFVAFPRDLYEVEVPGDPDVGRFERGESLLKRLGDWLTHTP